MDNQESGVMMRQRGSAAAVKESVDHNKVPAAEKSGFTAHNAEFDRQRYELRKRLVKDKASAAEELEVLEHRAEVLKEFLIEVDTASEKLEELNAVLNAEKEFTSRMEQLEIRYFRAFGKYSRQGNCEVSHRAGNNETPLPPTAGAIFYQALPFILGMIAAALIIAVAMALIFL